MAPAAGKVSLQFEVNASNFSSGVDKMNRQLKQFQNAAGDAGHSTVSSMQAASASIRLLENPMGNNIRAIERLISQSKVLSSVMQAAFPVVGAIALGTAVARMGAEFAASIKKFQEMPKTITEGFNAMHLATASATDGLRLTNDELQRSIDKLEGKTDTKNILAIQLDEARIKADALAKSLEHDADSVKKLLADNKLGSLSVMVGKGDTANVSGSVNSFEDQFKSLGFQAQDARRSGNTGQADDLQKQLQEKLKAALKWAENYQKFFDSPFALGDNSANKAIVQGFKSSVYDRMDAGTQQDRNGDLVGQQKAAQDAHAAAEKAAEARRKEAEEMAKGWATSLELAKQADTLARDMASFASESNNDFFKSAGVSSDDNNSLTKSGASANAWITSLRNSIDMAKQAGTAQAEFGISFAVATGQMTRQDAALATATLHLQEYNDALKQLQEQRAGIESNSHISDMERKAQLNNNQTAQGTLNANYQMQQASDNQAANPASSSAVTGFKDALDEFVNASRDAAGQMKQITESTLKSFNQTILSKNPDFKSFGAGVLKNVANAGLEKAEGSLLGGLGLGGGKLGTPGNPMHVVMAGGIGGAVGAGLGSILGKIGGGSGGGDGSTPVGNLVQKGVGALLHLLPGFAAGGPINGPAIVGENGPELYVPNSSGTIIPNHKLSSSSGSGGDSGVHFHEGAIDARGANDPAQVAAQVHRAIMQAAPHIMAGAVSLGKSQQNRRPSSAR